MYGEHCDICKSYVPEHICFVEDKNGRPLDVCGLCLDNLQADELVDDDGYLTFSFEVKKRECVDIGQDGRHWPG